MATENRLSARIKTSRDELLDEVEEDHGVCRAEAERVVLKEGLATLGYIERPTEAHVRLLWYVRRVGMLLGFVGLAAMGYGVFASRASSVIGFGLTMGAFLLVAVAEGLETYTEAGERR
jgi:hypothetical protein